MSNVKFSRREASGSLAAGTLAAAAGVDRKVEARMDTESADSQPYEVIIVGGSFAGLSAAMQLARARRRVLVLDTQKPRNRFAHASHGFFGQDGHPPLEMIKNARQQVLAYPTALFRVVAATHATRDGTHFTVTLGDGQTARGQRLILATGITDILPDIPGMKELWGTGVAHCPYCHGYEVADRKIAVFSLTDPNLHQALLLRDWSDDVTLLTNGNTAPSAEDSERLRQHGVKVETSPVTRLIRKGEELEAVEFADGRQVPFGALFIPARWTLTSPLAVQLGCEIEESAFGPIIKTDGFKATTVPGVFAAGDTARLYGNATFASADGVLAGSGVHRSLIFTE